jgi:hypothetical protein
MGRACSTDDRYSRNIYSDTVGKPEGRNQVEGLGVDGKEKIKNVFSRNRRGGFVLVHVARIGISGKLW